MILNKSNGDYCIINSDFISSRYSKYFTFTFKPIQDGRNDVYIFAGNSTDKLSISEIKSYNSNINYSHGDFVLDAGIKYISIKSNNIGNSISDEKYWIADTSGYGNFVLKLESNQNGSTIINYTNIPVQFGVDNTIKMKFTFLHNTKYLAEYFSISHGGKFVTGNQFQIFDRGKLVLGVANADLPIGVSNIQFKSFKIVCNYTEENYNFLMPSINTVDDYFISDLGNKALVNSSDIASLRSDVDLAFKTHVNITVTGNTSLIVGATINIAGVAGTPFVTDFKGEVNIKLPVGQYVVSIGAVNFDSTSFSLDAEGFYSKSISDLGLITVQTPTETITKLTRGTDTNIPKTVGDFFEMPDKRVLTVIDNEYKDVELLAGKTPKIFKSLAKAKQAKSLEIGDIIETLSYWGDDNLRPELNNNGGGGRFECVSKIGDDNYNDFEPNDGTIWVTNLGDIMRWVDHSSKDVDVKLFGAVSGVVWTQQKNPGCLNPYLTGLEGIPDCTDSIRRALKWLDDGSLEFTTTKLGDGIKTGKLNFKGHFFISNREGVDVNGAQGDAVITVPTSVSIWMHGASSVHSDTDAVTFRFLNSYRTNNRLNVYFRLWSNTNDRSWVIEEQWTPTKNYNANYIVRNNNNRYRSRISSNLNNHVSDSESWELLDQGIGDLNAKNRYSHGFELLNGRRNKFEIEAYGFVVGGSFYGKGEGAVENVMYLGDMRNNRYGVLCRSDFGGWATQNNIYNGRINSFTPSNRDFDIPIPDYLGLTKCISACMYLEGDNFYVAGVNCEGSGTLDKIIMESGVGNSVFECIRMEGNSSHSKAVDISKGSIIINGYAAESWKLRDIGSFHDNGINNPNQAKGLQGNESHITEGTIHLSGGYPNHPAAGTLSLQTTKSAGIYNFMTMIRDFYRINHIFYEDNSIEFNTRASGTNTYADILELHKRYPFYKQVNINGTINEWEENVWYGLGTWLYVDLKARHQADNIFTLRDYVNGNTYNYGDWFLTGITYYFATKTFIASKNNISNEQGLGNAIKAHTTDATDDYFWLFTIQNKTPFKSGTLQEAFEQNIFASRPLFNRRTLIKDGVVGAYDFANWTYDALPKKTTPLATRGFADNHSWNNSDSKIDLSSGDVLNFDLSQHTPTIFLHNTSGIERKLSFNRITGAKLRGKRFRFQNMKGILNSDPVRIANSNSGIRTYDGNDIILQKGEWIEAEFVRDLNNYPIMKEINRSDKSAYSKVKSGDFLSIPSNPEIGDKYFLTKINAEIQYNGSFWVMNGYQVIGTIYQRPTGIYTGYKYYDIDENKVVIWDGVNWV